MTRCRIDDVDEPPASTAEASAIEASASSNVNEPTFEEADASIVDALAVDEGVIHVREHVTDIFWV